ncbi:hypothetical protein B0T25DRAFT_509349 [Lasiosphaeria hispida]|uniref:Defect at low temperature protein 1 n=1 Tax=Lasiosphaeria hispida TaxID=260671 RepID=A0AAJ0H9T9_9PEZI|nr:hypothetical protein B0T25DRAFT_509349 [Lasiosphaeria hispida]
MSKASAFVHKAIYIFSYYVLYLILLGFLIVTPADLINQAVEHNQKYNILVIALCSLVTALVLAFIYATRLYINRSVLASIPKGWVPVEMGDVPRDVRAVIVEGLSRSAAVAFEARPRVPLLPPVVGGLGISGGGRMAWMEKLRRGAGKGSAAARDLDEGAVGIDIPQHRAVWGEIEHPGWVAPTSPDLPDLQYDTVISELPNLIEAKALTLAPPDPESQADPPLLDPEAVGLLQRPESMGLREYLGHLTDLAVLAPLPTTSDFLAQYECARFSTRPVTNEQFRSLMHLFAEILRNMHPLSPSVLARYESSSSGSASGSASYSSGEAPSESDIDNDAPRRSSPSSSSGTAHSVKRGPPRSRLRTPTMAPRNSSANTWQFRTAPTTPKSRHTGLSRASSNDSFAQSRHPYPASRVSSGASMRSGYYSGSGGGSVIRLATSDDGGDLPYVLLHPQSPP